jgi:hypothetical protein
MIASGRTCKLVEGGHRASGQPLLWLDARAVGEALLGDSGQALSGLDHSAEGPGSRRFEITRQRLAVIGSRLVEVLCHQGLWRQDVGFGVHYEKDPTRVLVLVSPGDSGLTAKQVLDRLLGRGWPRAQLPSAPVSGREPAVHLVVRASGPPGLLVDGLGVALDPFGCVPALVACCLALPAVAPEVGRSGRPTGVAGCLVRAEELVEQAVVVRLRRLGLQASPRGSDLPAVCPSPGGGQGRDEQHGDGEAEPGRQRQQPTLRVAGDGLVEHRDLADGGVLP